MTSLKSKVQRIINSTIKALIFAIHKIKMVPRLRKPRPVSIAYSFTQYVTDFREAQVLFGKLAYIKSNRSKFHTLVMGLERCPTTKRPHIQGYIFFNEPRTQHYAHWLFPKAHIEPSRESPYKNYEYCTKCPDSLKIGDIDNANFIWNLIILEGGPGVPPRSLAGKAVT